MSSLHSVSSSSRNSVNSTVTGEAVLLIDVRDETVMAASRAVETLLGFPPSEIIGKRFSDLHGHVSFYSTRQQTSGVGEEIISLPCRRADGSEVQLDARFNLAEGRDRCLKVVTLQASRSDARRPEVEALRAHLEKQALQNITRQSETHVMEEKFLSKLSHQFRTPLGVILSSAGIISRYDSALSSAQRKEYLSAIEESVRNLTRLLEDIVWFGRLQISSVPFRPQTGDLCQLCRNAIEEARSANERPVSIVFTPHGITTPLSFDENLLRLILVHLLSNAIKFSPGGEPIQFEVRYDGARCVFTVRDFGIGISLQEQSWLFEPFRRGENVANVPGHGLGLALVKACVTLHGGSVAVESLEGAGATFRVSLPVSQDLPEITR